MQHIADTVTECGQHLYACIVLVQLFQQAARFYLHQLCQIILIIIINECDRHIEQAILQ